jgi:hypothetical protein
MTLGDPQMRCPLCNSPSDLVLSDAHIYVKRTREQKVGAHLKMFHCKSASHIFFVRSDDLAKAMAQLAAVDSVVAEESAGQSIAPQL